MSNNIEISLNGINLTTYIEKSIEDKLDVRIKSLDENINNITNENNQNLNTEIHNAMKHLCDVSTPALINETFSKKLNNEIKETYKKLSNKYSELTEETIKKETNKILIDFIENKHNDIIINKFCEKIVDTKLSTSETSPKNIKLLVQKLDLNKDLLESVREKNRTSRYILGFFATFFVSFIVCYHTGQNK